MVAWIYVPPEATQQHHNMLCSLGLLDISPSYWFSPIKKFISLFYLLIGSNILKNTFYNKNVNRMSWNNQAAEAIKSIQNMEKLLLLQFTRI